MRQAFADPRRQGAKTSLELFLKQNAFTAAQQQFKLAQRAVVEDIFRGLDMPTRSELDETYQVIHELKKEVRALKKALLPAAPAAVAKSSPAPRKAAAARAKSE